MTLNHNLVFAALGLAVGRLYPRLNRAWLLFAASVLAVFWLQPASLIRNLPFLLPVASLGLAVLVWALTQPKEHKATRQDWLAVVAIAAIAILVSVTRFLDPIAEFFAVRPPGLDVVVIALIIVAILAAAAWLLRGRSLILNAVALLIVVILIVLKAPPLAQAASAALRGFAGQDPALASPLDFGWLGFSYLAFRLIHVLRDRLAGRLPQVSLRDFVTYIVFFPALSAGPIDRVERFAPQLQSDFLLGGDQLLAAGRRLVVGLFMKFVLADGLAYFALNATNAHQVSSTGWMWVLLIAFAFRIYCDFAGYTHIAIGLGMLFGVVLPENFDRPYLKPNLTAFWNSWHMTLAQWFRAYWFNPLTRWLRTHAVPVWLVIFTGQLSTMALIGLWHGITWNFLAWGAWHGAGLFIHNQWVSFAKTRQLLDSRFLVFLSTLFTFLFVTLGWVWFALPAPQEAARVFTVLFGIN